MKKLILITIIFFGAFLISCQKHGEHASTASKRYTCSMHPQIVQDKPGTCPICGMDLVLQNAVGRNDGSLMLSESQIKLANITTMLTHNDDIENTTILNGKLVVDEEQTEVISARVKGRIEKLYYKEPGKSIKKGEPLYEIYSEDLLVLQQEYLLALKQKNELGQNERRYDNFLDAAKKKLILLGLSEKQIKNLGDASSGNLTIAVSAAATGVISKIEIVEGQYVDAGTTLYKVEKLDKLWVEAELYPSETHLAYPGDLVEIEVIGFENEPMTGKVVFIYPEFRSGTQTILLRAAIENYKRQFLPGMQARMLLKDQEKKVITLPTDAVIRDANGNHVWVRNQDGSFAPRNVLIGLDNPDRVEIRYGLEENENVVVTGAYLLYGELVLKKGGLPNSTHDH